MLIRLVKKVGTATVIEHVCSSCASVMGIDTSKGTWATVGWCYLCGHMAGAKVNPEGHRPGTALDNLHLGDTDKKGGSYTGR